MNPNYFIPIHISVDGTGALINSSKKRFAWRFELDSSEHLVELECSFLTNKRRVSVDGSLIFRGTKALLSRDFEYQFKLGSHVLTIQNGKSDSNLFIDNLSFNELYSKRLWDKMHSTKPEKNILEGVTEAKPARYISEEEYNAASKVSEAIKSARTLRDILDQRASNPKPKGLVLSNCSPVQTKEDTHAIEDLLDIGTEHKNKEKTHDLIEIGEVQSLDIFQYKEKPAADFLQNFENDILALDNKHAQKRQDIDLFEVKTTDHKVSESFENIFDMELGKSEGKITNTKDSKDFFNMELGQSENFLSLDDKVNEDLLPDFVNAIPARKFEPAVLGSKIDSCNIDLLEDFGLGVPENNKKSIVNNEPSSIFAKQLILEPVFLSVQPE